MSLVKRFIATLMLVLFLLNVLGYYGIFEGLKAQSEIAWSSQAGENEEGLGQTVTFAIPLAVPYATDSQEYQQIQGQFEYGGEVYQLVKQKLLRDTLYVVGVKDEASSMWGRALADYVMTFGDTSGDDDSQSTTAQAGFIKDFISASVSVNRDTAGWSFVITPSARAAGFIATFEPSFVHPPERA
jgi:hypothetical protein